MTGCLFGDYIYIFKLCDLFTLGVVYCQDINRSPESQDGLWIFTDSGIHYPVVQLIQSHQHTIPQITGDPLFINF